MKNLLILLTALLLVNISFAQRTYPDNNIVLLPQMFPLNQLSSYGYTSLTGTSSNVTSLNPAALSSFDRFSVGASYQFQTTLKNAWIADIGSKWISSADPQSAGLIFPVGDFRLAAGMTQLYRATLDIGRIAITTTDQPDGTGEFITPEYETKINQYSFSGSYLIRNVFGTENNMSLGIRINYSNIHEYQDIGMIKIDERFNAVDFAAGAVYNIQNIKLGLSFESGIDERTNYQLSGSDLYVPIFDSVQAYKIAQNFTLRCTTPTKLNAGILAELKNNFIISGNVNYLWWNNIQDNSHSEWQLSGSLVYKASVFFSGSAGLLYILETYGGQSNIYFDMNDRLSALYITMGARINLKNFYADLSLADSHLTGGDWREHTIGKVALGYNF